MRYIDQKILNEWGNKVILITDNSLAIQFSDFINKLPWLAGHLDFSKINSVSASVQNFLDDNDDICYEKIYAWLNEYGSFNSKYVSFWYTESNPCVICDAEFGLANFDSAYWGVPGWNYMFGCCVENNIITPDYNSILCYDSADTLILLRIK